MAFYGCYYEFRAIIIYTCKVQVGPEPSIVLHTFGVWVNPNRGRTRRTCEASLWRLRRGKGDLIWLRIFWGDLGFRALWRDLGFRALWGDLGFRALWGDLGFRALWGDVGFRVQGLGTLGAQAFRAEKLRG